MKSVRKLRSVVIIGGLGLLCATSSAQADLELQLSGTGATTYTSAPTDTGSVSYIASPFGVFTVVEATGVGSPVVGSLSNPVLDTSTVDVSSGTAGTLTIMLSQTGNTASAPVGIISAFSGNVVGASVTAQSFLDTSDNYFGISGSSVTSTTSLNGSGLSFSATASDATNVVGTYSLTEVLTITFGTGGGYVSLDYTVSTPEPSTMAIASLGTLGMIGFGLRQRKALGA